MKKITLLLISTLLYSSVLAQKKPSLLKKYRNYRIEKFKNENISKTKLLGLSNVNFQNTVFSKNQYSGLGLNLQFLKDVNLKGYNNHFENNISFNIISPKAKNDLILNLNLYFSKAKLKIINPNIQVGVEGFFRLNVFGSPNFENNAIMLNSSLGLSPAILASKKLTKKIDISTYASYPVLGINLSTPTYAFTGDNIGISSLNILNSVSPKVGIIMKFGKTKRYSNKNYVLGYSWQMNHFKIGTYESYTSGIHNISFIGNITRIK